MIDTDSDFLLVATTLGDSDSDSGFDSAPLDQSDLTIKISAETPHPPAPLQEAVKARGFSQRDCSSTVRLSQSRDSSDAGSACCVLPTSNRY